MGNDACGKNQGLITETVRVWDLPTRLFHWLLVLLIGWEWASSHLGQRFLVYHMWGGYAVLALLVFRLLWGLIGSETARFSSFVASPRRVWQYLRSAGKDTCWRLGHNPLGGWSVMAFLLVLSVQVGTGLFATDDILTAGPLNRFVRNRTGDLLTHIHKLNFDLILGLVGIHILAIIAHRVIGKHDLVKPMLTGHADLPAPAQRPAPFFARLWLAGLVALASVLATWLVVTA